MLHGGENAEGKKADKCQSGIRDGGSGSDSSRVCPERCERDLQYSVTCVQDLRA